MTRRLERKNHELINLFLTLSITQDFRFYLTSFEPRKINFSELVFCHTMLYTFYLISHLCIFHKNCDSMQFEQYIEQGRLAMLG